MIALPQYELDEADAIDGLEPEHAEALAKIRAAKQAAKAATGRETLTTAQLDAVVPDDRPPRFGPPKRSSGPPPGFEARRSAPAAGQRRCGNCGGLVNAFEQRCLRCGERPPGRPDAVPVRVAPAKADAAVPAPAPGPAPGDPRPRFAPRPGKTCPVCGGRAHPRNGRCYACNPLFRHGRTGAAATCPTCGAGLAKNGRCYACKPGSMNGRVPPGTALPPTAAVAPAVADDGTDAELTVIQAALASLRKLAPAAAARALDYLAARLKEDHDA